MNTPASAVVPSHEAVEKWCINPHTGHPFEAANMLRTLLAEVERLTAENKSLCWYGSNEERAQLRTTVAQLERTVADQAAALAERDKVLRMIEGGYSDSESPSLELPPAEFRAAMWTWSQKKARAALAASVSSASEEGGT